MSALDATDMEEIKKLIEAMDYEHHSDGGFSNNSIYELAQRWEDFYALWFKLMYA